MVGTFLWLTWGAVRGVAYWRVTAGSYVLSLAIAGALFGLLWPGSHLRTGMLLVVPGMVALLSPDPGGHPDLTWWLLSLVTGMGAAVGTHWLAVELRQWLSARHFR